MKAQEAIRCIEDILNSDYHYDESLGYQLTSDDFEWLKKSKEALEKQIPKKGTIKYLSSYTDDPPALLCPNCQEHIPTEGCNFYRYCYKCGQSLDWSDHQTEKDGEQE